MNAIVLRNDSIHFSIGHTPKHLVPAHLSFGELVINNLHPEKLIYK